MHGSPPDQEFPEPENVAFADSATVAATLFTPEESSTAKGGDQPGPPEGLVERPDELHMVECVRVQARDTSTLFSEDTARVLCYESREAIAS